MLCICFRADSGFRHVTKEEYKPRLLHFKGTKVRKAAVCIKVVPRKVILLKNKKAALWDIIYYNIIEIEHAFQSSL